MRRKPLVIAYLRVLALNTLWLIASSSSLSVSIEMVCCSFDLAERSRKCTRKLVFIFAWSVGRLVGEAMARACDNFGCQCQFTISSQALLIPSYLHDGMNIRSAAMHTHTVRTHLIILYRQRHNLF